MSYRFAGRIGLVTGAASGIGAAFAQRCADEGAIGLALLDRDAEALDGIAAILSCPVIAIAADVADEGAWSRFEQNISQDFGRIDFALVNAGTGHAMTPIRDLELGEWERVISANLTGSFLTLRAALRLIVDGGALAIVASSMGIKASPNTAGYGASKAALIHLAKIAALEAAPRGIRVNAISPGGVITPLFREYDFFKTLVEQVGSEAGAFAALAQRSPLGSYASADETAELIAFLLSDAARQVTGANFVADAGMTL